jgi:homeodomain-containing protein
MKSKYAVCLSDVERARWRTLIGSGTAPARHLAHARILLKADQSEAGPGWNDQAIAGALEVCTATVARVRQQYVTAGLEAALNRRWPARAYTRTLDGEVEAHLIALACSTPPRGRQRWSLRLLAKEVVRLGLVEAVSYETVRQTLKQTT